MVKEPVSVSLRRKECLRRMGEGPLHAAPKAPTLSGIRRWVGFAPFIPAIRMACPRAAGARR